MIYATYAFRLLSKQKVTSSSCLISQLQFRHFSPRAGHDEKSYCWVVFFLRWQTKQQGQWGTIEFYLYHWETDPRNSLIVLVCPPKSLFPLLPSLDLPLLADNEMWCFILFYLFLHRTRSQFSRSELDTSVFLQILIKYVLESTHFQWCL